jgi:glycosyltransferase involved in cell wall biosynthesis
LAQTGVFKLKVFYTWSQAIGKVHDNDFGLTREWDVDLLAGYDHEFVHNISTQPGSNHYRGIINPDLIGKVYQFNPDAILIYGWKFDSHLKLMRHFHGKLPILFRGDSTLLNETPGFSIRKFLRFSALKWVYGHIDIALSPGKSSDDYFKACGLIEDQIIRAPHVVDNDFFSVETDQKEKEAMVWRKQLAIPDDHKVFLFAGKLEPQKDPELLINAFFKLLEKRQDIHLIIVGSGILENKLKALVASLTKSLTSDICRLTSVVSFIPFQNQSRMPIIYRMADVFVLPSRSETWGLAVNEAMASGRPVIVSNKCGCAKELIEDGKNGFVFIACNEQDLITKMGSTLLADTQMMRQYATEKIKQFNFSTFSKQLTSALSFKHTSK